MVDVDLEKFFDRVNNDVMMAKLQNRIRDRRVLGIIHRILRAGADAALCDMSRKFLGYSFWVPRPDS